MRIERGVDYDLVVPPELDRDIWIDAQDGRATEIANGFLHHGLRSHVLLAACSSKEKAEEDRDEKRGYFSKALLDILTVISADQITYTELICRIQIFDSSNIARYVCLVVGLASSLDILIPGRFAGRILSARGTTEAGSSSMPERRVWAVQCTRSSRRARSTFCNPEAHTA